jgi:hypothetical protein
VALILSFGDVPGPLIENEIACAAAGPATRRAPKSKEPHILQSIRVI